MTRIDENDEKSVINDDFDEKTHQNDDFDEKSLKNDDFDEKLHKLAISKEMIPVSLTDHSLVQVTISGACEFIVILFESCIF